jgi:hypothetical protein
MRTSAYFDKVARWLSIKSEQIGCNAIFLPRKQIICIICFSALIAQIYQSRSLMRMKILTADHI